MGLMPHPNAPVKTCSARAMAGRFRSLAGTLAALLENRSASVQEFKL